MYSYQRLLHSNPKVHHQLKSPFQNQTAYHPTNSHYSQLTSFIIFILSSISHLFDSFHSLNLPIFVYFYLFTLIKLIFFTTFIALIITQKRILLSFNFKLSLNSFVLVLLLGPMMEVWYYSYLRTYQLFLLIFTFI
jgi:hypothetical protein